MSDENKENDKVIKFSKIKGRDKMAAKNARRINPTTEVTDKEIADKIRESAKKEPSKKARRINKNALELLRSMRE